MLLDNIQQETTKDKRGKDCLYWWYTVCIGYVSVGVCGCYSAGHVEGVCVSVFG